MTNPFQLSRPLVTRTAAMRRIVQRSGLTRGGFTLIELMVVIIIISAIMALLLPAVMSVRSKARITQVKTEIAGLEAAISRFKTDFGVDPPSMITLSESSTGWTASDRALIRRIWNNFQFGNTDFNGDGDTNDTIGLSGSECLVFFLGGMAPPRASTTETFQLTGFSKNRLVPFARGGNREGPFFEFDAGRLGDPDGDGFPSYRDVLQTSGDNTPYLYFSSYEGRGYTTDTNATWGNTDNSLYMKRCYYLKIPSGTTPAGASAHKPQTFQIISPGFDGEYGVGGVFDASNPALLTEDLDNDGTLDAGEDLNGNGKIDTRENEYDNITNFKEGQLN